MSNLFKSIFISAFLTFCSIALIIAIQNLFEQFSIEWLAVLISSLPLLAVIGYFFIVGTPRTSANLWPMLLIASGGGLLALYQSFQVDEVSQLPIMLAVFAAVGTWFYVFWYSKLIHKNDSVLKSGQTLPEFSVQDLSGNSISSSDWLGQKNLIIFYRGNWCPLCMAQIKEVAASYSQLADDGIRIALISPQSPKHTQSLANKFSVPFEYFIDVNNQAAKQVGIEAENGLPTGLQVFGYDSDTVMPTVIITDIQNNIIFADLTDNYRVRPEPETFLKILQTGQTS